MNAKMKTKLALTITMLSLIASAQTLKITQTNGTITLSIASTNLYAVLQTTSLTNGFTALTNVIGNGLTATFQKTNVTEFYRAEQIYDFLIYATPIASVGGGSDVCTGSFIGYAWYYLPGSQYGWVMATNAPFYIASDGTGRTDTAIYAESVSGAYACGPTPLRIPYQYDPTEQYPYLFWVYFPSNLPSGPYPLRLQGFLP